MLYGAMNSPLHPILDEIEVLAEMGFDYIELTMDPPEAHHHEVRKKSRDILKRLNSGQLGLVCHLPTFVYTADLTESLRKASVGEMLRSLDAAARLEPMKVVIHPSFFNGLGALVRHRADAYAAAYLEMIVEKADQHGMPLCLENLPPSSKSLVTPDDFDPVFGRFPGLKMTLDIGHANLVHGQTTAMDFIERFPDRIGHIHASDNFGKEDQHLPIGAGMVPFHDIVRTLKRSNYDGTITLEIFSKDRDYLTISRKKLAKMFDTLSREQGA